MRKDKFKQFDRYSYDSSTEGLGKRVRRLDEKKKPSLKGKHTGSSEVTDRFLSRRTPHSQLPPLSDTQWNALVAKGQQLYQDVALALQNPEDKECPYIAEIAESDSESGSESGSESDSFWDIQGDQGAPSVTLQRIIHFVNSAISFDPSIWRYISAEWPAGRLNPLYYYRNFFSPQTRSIVGHDNRGKDGSDRASVRLSDMTFQLWRSTSVKKGLPTQSLTWIWQEHITNAYTLNVTNHIYNRLGWWAKDEEGADTARTQAWVFDKDHGGAAFYALLTTPNAIGYSYMLKDYPESLGSTIKKVGIAWIDLTAMDTARRDLGGNRGIERSDGSDPSEISDSDGDSDSEEEETELFYMWIELQPPTGYGEK